MMSYTSHYYSTYQLPLTCKSSTNLLSGTNFHSVFFFHIFLCSGLLCKVSAGNDVACLTTNHLAALAKLEPRLVPLVLAFRYWARVSLYLMK